MAKLTSCTDPESFVRGEGGGGVQLNFDNVFLPLILVDEGREEPNTTKIGPLSVCQWNAI